MNKSEASNWHYAMSVHEDVWDLDLSHSEFIAYAYLTTYCKRGYAISLTIMARRIRMDSKRLRLALNVLIDRRMIAQSQFVKGHPRTFMVITRRSKGWGQTPPSLGSNAPTPLGSNAPTPWGQTPLLTSNLDSTFLSLFHTHFEKWTFNRKPIGSHFVFTRRMQTQALECMRWLHKNMAGFSTPDSFNSFLSSCQEYLALPRDVLCSTTDQRALSPAKWLNNWDEQIRLAGIYRDEQRKNVVRMPPAVDNNP